ncbi:hypothetical protein TRFO_30742 [Tritrichomonas foetus]|uniref:Poly [ADP-ribose] polymerase n=1 Tax=Tritrichomonas foetus TaxID=1144522 RepID=A0A1J4JU38_9EUKA|nr:hypothetical protein TRFO_30742 [Tritrichomonas foetus]|eukprot:OHT02226.1 hypothetical protein TRFO_30742 [Tritrichomonas foetus]
MSKQNHHRRTLIHQTDLRSAETIIRTQIMRPGSGGCYGAGIYFANTFEACDHKSHKNGVYLVADVYLGKTKALSYQQIDPNNLKKEGYDSVVGLKMPTGREFIVYDSNRVKNIKYAYGTRPQVVFTSARDRLVLFWVTNPQEASRIVRHQHIPMTSNGRFSDGFYMYDSVTDALQEHPQATTFLAADVHIKKRYNLSNRETITSLMRRRYKSFSAQVNGFKYYIVVDPRQIVNIHFSGGALFDR